LRDFLGTKAELKYSYSQGDKVLDPRVKESFSKKKWEVLYDLNRLKKQKTEGERLFFEEKFPEAKMFDNFAMFDKRNEARISFAWKQRQNEVSSRVSPSKLQQISLQGDSLFQTKLSYRINRILSPHLGFLENSKILKASLEHKTNFQSLSLVQFKAFCRFSRRVSDNLLLQVGLSGGCNFNLTPKSPLLINDRFFP